LLNEFLKEHRKVEQLEKQIEKLTAGLQKVNVRLEMSRPVPHIAESNSPHQAINSHSSAILSADR
jgi:hypothetical protein